MSKLEHMGDKRDRQTLKTTIEENLRKVYQDLLSEEVPDRFKTLLDQLRQQGPQQDTEPPPPDAPRSGPEDGK